MASTVKPFTINQIFEQAVFGSWKNSRVPRDASPSETIRASPTAFPNPARSSGGDVAEPSERDLADPQASRAQFQFGDDEARRFEEWSAELPSASNIKGGFFQFPTTRSLRPGIPV